MDLSQVDDLELTSRARVGDERAVVELWTRHYPAALSTARRVARQPRDAEELASDAFSGMLSALRSGGGPTGSVRAYLLTSVRNGLTTRSRRADASDVLTDENAVLDNAADIAPDPVAAAGELSLVREAFAALPTRWQHVLWRTAVDHESNISVAQELGVSPNAVAALARRARQGLRSAYVQAHVSRGAVDPGCEPFIGGLAALLTSHNENSATAQHVRGCARCTERLAELRKVDRNLSGLLAPAVLGLAPGTGALAGVGAPATEVTKGVLKAANVPNAGSWVAIAAAVTVGAGALTWALWPQGVAAPRPTAPAKTVAPSLPPVAAPSPTTTVPRRTASGTPTRVPTVPPRAVVPAPGAPSAPSATLRPTQTPTPTPSPQPVGQLSAAMAMGGSTTAPFVQVSASGSQLVGGVRLRLTVPVGVSITGSSGSWQGCAQQGTTITCVASSAPSQQWSGSIVTAWPSGVSGTVAADVSGEYRSGGPADATAATHWPPP